jgi:serine/threonine-protein kinase
MFLRIIKIGALFIAFAFAAGASTYLALTFFIKSEGTVVVPDLTGKDVVYALEMLTDLGLNTKVKGSEYSRAIPKNQIIFQSPEPGTEMKKGRDVNIILSKGPQYVAMPNIVGLSTPQAHILLEENGLCRGDVSSIYSDTIPIDQIVSQAPHPREMVERGRCVDLLASLGAHPEVFEMFDLQGLSVDEAILRIEASDLRIGQIKTQQKSNKRPNSILTQDPPPGYRIARGAVINLTVNKSSIASTSTGSATKKRIGLFRYRVAAGFLKKQIRIRMDSMGVSSILFNELVRPGEEIWLVVPTQNNATLFLYEDDELAKTQIY